MLKRFFIAMCLLSSSLSFGQEVKKVFFNEAGDITIKDSASYYTVYKQQKDGLYKMEVRDAKTGNLKSAGICTSTDSKKKEGHFSYYTDNGYVKYEGDYLNNKEDGIWTHYYSDTKDVWYTVSYKEGKRSGDLKSYYKSGKLKRVESFLNDTGSTGICYDEDGRTIPFTHFEKMPQCPYKLMEYLGNNIVYPSVARRKGIEGRVLITFIVKPNGAISDVKVKRGIGGGCDEVAQKVIEDMPNWNPGIMDDEKVSVWFTQPISFKLE